MFEILTDEDNRGQVGIGTLIVFIAMVLVAAIAAGVLINTAGVLQTQASDTGSETQEQVANQIEVLHASGEVGADPGESGTVESVGMTLMKSAGSNEIDLESMTVQYTSDHTDKTLTHGDVADSDTFTTSPLHGGTDGNSLTTKDDRVELTLNTQAIEANGDDGSGTLGISSDSSDLTLEDFSIDSGENPQVGGDIEFTIEDTDANTDGTYGGDVSVVVTNDDGETIVDDELGGGETFVVESSDFTKDGLTVDLDDGTAGQSIDSITVEDLDDDAEGLQPGTSATVSLVDQSGAQFTYGISVPSTFGGASIVEV